MYGLINNSLKEMILDRFGEEQWQRILDVSTVPEDSFLTMRSYDDAITYSLVGAASEVLGAPLDTCLEMFGEYWVLETASKSYGMLLDSAGDNIIDFLHNMNALHDRITSTFLDYVPPDFQVEDKNGRHLIHYRSEREGLTPFVVGLLRGLAIRFGNELTIHAQYEKSMDSGTHTVFEVEVA